MANPMTHPTENDDEPGDDPASTKPQKTTRRDAERRGPPLRTARRAGYYEIIEGAEEENDRARSPSAPSSFNRERNTRAAASA